MSLQLSLIRIVISPTQIELFQRNTQVCCYTFDELARATHPILGTLDARDGSPMNVEGISKPLLTEMIAQASFPERAWRIEALGASDNHDSQMYKAFQPLLHTDGYNNSLNDFREGYSS